MTILDHLLHVRAEKGAGYLALLDPDKLTGAALTDTAVRCVENGVDAVMIGSSLLFSTRFDETVREVKQHVNIPVILFPGGSNQLSRYADAILFLSLVSGRNAHYLIGDQVRAAPLIKEFGIEPIPTGYLLIESGQMTSAEFISDTRPIPREKPAMAMAHALAAEYLGMKMIYLEAGSGAQRPVPDILIRKVHDYVSIPLIVGGGIRDPRIASNKVDAGADFIVTGNILEERVNPALIREFADAIHRPARDHAAL